MLCPSCGAENRDGAKFCDECGARLFASEIPQQDVPQEPLPLPNMPQFGDFDDGYDDEPIDDWDMDDDSYNYDEMDEEEGESTSALQVAPADATVNLNAAAATQMLTPQAEVTRVIPAAPAGAETTRIPQANPAQQAEDSYAGFDYEYDPGYERGGTMEMPRVEGAPAPTSTRFTAGDADEAEKGKKGHGRVIAIVLIVLALIGAAVFGTWYFELWGGLKVPDVVSLTEADAEQALIDKGFNVRVETVMSDDDEGIVLLTDPAAGERLEAGSEVIMHVSIARTIPEVVGLTQEEAEQLFASQGFTNVTFTTEKSNETEGTVIGVSPDEGEKVKAAHAITVTVAESYVVPDVVGKSSADARAALEEEGYNVIVNEYNTEDYTEGTVVFSDPEGGVKLNSGSDVVINVAVSRKTQLENATWAYGASLDTLTVGGANYTVDSVDSVSYTGENTTTMTFTGRPYVWLLVEYVYGSSTSVTATITWDDNNNVVSVS